MSDALDCEPVPSSVRSARLFVVDKLQEWHLDDLVDSVALLTSELVTNAIVHTGQPFSVRVQRRGSGVRVEVADLDPVLPVHRKVEEEPVAVDRLFSGLEIVDRTASAWGAERVRGNGKVVWFEVWGGQGAGGSRGAMSELSELRSPAPSAGAAAHDGGAVASGHLAPAAEAPVIHLGGSRRRGAGVVVLVALGMAALALAWLVVTQG